MKGSRLPKTQNETGSICSHHYKTRSCVTRSSQVGSNKATTQDSASARTSKCKGKSAALSLPGPTVNGRNGASCTIRFAAPNIVDGKNIVDDKNMVSSHIASKLIREKSLKSCLEKDIIGYIRAGEDICEDHVIKPLGARCQLCKLDLAFTPKNLSESIPFNELPTCGVLSCGHCYHMKCLEAVFGSVEPPCITCLGC